MNLLSKLVLRTCKEAAALVVAREDRPLAWNERLSLSLHLRVCKTCPRWERQLLTIRHAMHQWRHYGSDNQDA
jgi:hypothetical protein